MKTFDIQPVDRSLAEAIQHKIDNLNKPKGSLGQLEELAMQVCLIQQTLEPSLAHPCHLLLGGDHGIEREGVSVSPREVTWQQMINFTRGGGGVNMFCRQHGFKLRVVDVGVDYDFSGERLEVRGERLPIIDRKIARGTKNFLYEPAMSEEEFNQAIAVGVNLVDDCIAEGCRVLCIGEMGIGNTSPSSIWMSLFGDIPLKECIGAGAGLNNDGIRHKYEVLSRAVANYKASPKQGRLEGSLFIAHELTQFSPNDVTIFSNCDSVRLTALNGWKTATLPVVHDKNGIPNAPVTFTGFWDFWKAREQSYTNRSWQNVKLVAEGIIGDSVVCRVEKMPSRRSTKFRLYADEMGRQLVADGSDFIVVVAEVTDDNGNVRRLARESITFIVEGEGSIIGDASIGANPRIVEWGSAPVLVRSTHKAGKITIIARPTYEGVHAPTADTLTIESIPAQLPQCYREQQSQNNNIILTPTTQPKTMSDAERRRSLEEVERQQQDFGIK